MVEGHDQNFDGLYPKPVSNHLLLKMQIIKA